MLKPKKPFNVAEIFYFIGGGLAALGVGILLYQNWEFFSLGTKLLATIGFGVASQFAGMVFFQRKETVRVGMAFFLIAALVLPIGLRVVIDALGYSIGYGAHTCMAATMFVLYLVFASTVRSNVFTLFAVLYATWLFFSITSLIVDGTAFNTSDLVYGRFLVTGLSYILIGYSFSRDERSSLSPALYDLGIFAVLGAALLLGGYDENSNLFWELIYPVLIIATMCVSVFLKSKGFLLAGALFLVAYIVKITREYFADSVGWPLALVLIGMGIVGVGYLSVSMHKRYFLEKK